MYIEELLEKYPMEVVDVRKGRGNVYAITKQGKMCLSPYAGNEGRARFLDGLLRTVQKEGVQVEQLIQTKESTFLVEDEEGIRYIMRTCVEGKECDTKVLEEVLLGMRTLAKLHQKMSPVGEAYCNTFSVDKNRVLHNYERHTREMRTIKNYVANRKIKSMFEQEFLSVFQDFNQQANDVLAQMAEQWTEHTMGICHGDYQHHNIMVKEREVAVIRFDSFCYDSRVSDIVRFLRKILEKNGWNPNLGIQLLEAYGCEETLTVSEKKQIFLRLSYPEKFWKIANHYYGSNKAWGVNRYYEKLEKILRDEKKRKEFLESLKEDWLLEKINV